MAQKSPFSLPHPVEQEYAPHASIAIGNLWLVLSKYLPELLGRSDQAAPSYGPTILSKWPYEGNSSFRSVFLGWGHFFFFLSSPENSMVCAIDNFMNFVLRDEQEKGWLFAAVSALCQFAMFGHCSILSTQSHYYYY